MNSRADQLFLELCLLGLRYTREEIEQVANVRRDPDKTNILALLAILRDLRAIVADKPLMTPKTASRKKSEGTFRKKAAAANRDDKSDTEPFVNLANTLMRK
jgi:hypothetical protein